MKDAMPQVTYVSHDGKSTTLDVPLGTSVMQAATLHGLDGIVAECGGSSIFRSQLSLNFRLGGWRRLIARAVMANKAEGGRLPIRRRRCQVGAQ